MDNEKNISAQTGKSLFTRNFVLGFLTFMAFLTANYTLVPTFPIYLKRLGSHEAEIGVLVGTYGIASLASRLFVGRALLKYRAKNVMMAGAALFAISFLAYITFRPFWPLVIVRFFQGVAFSGLDTAALAYVVNVIPPAYRARGIGYIFLAPPFSAAVAPSLGMILLNQYGASLLFLTCTGFSFSAFFFALALKKREPFAADRNASAQSSGFFERRIIAPAIMSFFSHFISGAVMAFFPLYAIQCGVVNPGHFFSAFAITLIAARTLGGRVLDIFSGEKIIVAGTCVVMVGIVVLSLSNTLPMFIVVGVLWGLGYSFLNPAFMAYSLEYAGSSSGTAIGTFQVFMDLGVALGPIVTGLMAPLIGYPVMFFCLALVYLINLGYFQFYVKKRGGMASGVGTTT